MAADMDSGPDCVCDSALCSLASALRSGAPQNAVPGEHATLLRSLLAPTDECYRATPSLGSVSLS